MPKTASVLFVFDPARDAWVVLCGHCLAKELLLMSHGSVLSYQFRVFNITDDDAGAILDNDNVLPAALLARLEESLANARKH